MHRLSKSEKLQISAYKYKKTYSIIYTDGIGTYRNLKIKIWIFSVLE